MALCSKASTKLPFCWHACLCNNSNTLFQKRGKRYDSKGRLMAGKIPHGWRKVNHNPAKIPKAWIPDSWKKNSVIDYDRERELAKYIPGYEPNLPEHEHPDYKTEPMYHFTPDTRLVEGLRQALSLTKCVLIERMPPQINELSKKVSIPDQDERVIQVFKHALLFDVDPRNLDKTGTKTMFNQDHFNIYPKIDRYCPTILQNLMRLCQSQAKRHPTLLKRLSAQDVETCASFRRGFDYNHASAEHLEKNWKVSISGIAGTQILSTEPLKPFADKREVEDTASMSIPDIFPVFPIVDLKKSHVYNEKNHTGFKPGFSHNHLHTLVIENIEGFTAEEMYAKMASHLFACLYARAVDMYGDLPMDLPTPTMGQCIASDGQNFQFLCMQLNTTKLDDDSGIKNMAWIENYEDESDDFFVDTLSRPSHPWFPLYGACSHRVWRSAEYYTDYDPRVFQTFLSLWINGAS